MINGEQLINYILQLHKNVIFGNIIVLDGDNKWIFHTPDDGRKQLYIAPWTNGGWHWAHQAVFNP